MRVCAGHTLYKDKNGALSASSPSGEENTSPDVQALLRAFLCELDVAFAQSPFRFRPCRPDDRYAGTLDVRPDRHIPGIG